MATKKKKASAKKKPAKKAKPAPQVKLDPKEEYLLILINATKRYMDGPECAMAKQLIRLERELEELRSPECTRIRLKTYTMPDGTKTMNKPKDGEVVRMFAGDKVTVVTWQWDGMKEQWFNISSGSPNKYNTASYPYVGIDFAHPDFDQDMELANRKVIKCECGSESVGSQFHSSWCPKK